MSGNFDFGLKKFFNRIFRLCFCSGLLYLILAIFCNFEGNSDYKMNDVRIMYVLRIMYSVETFDFSSRRKNWLFSTSKKSKFSLREHVYPAETNIYFLLRFLLWNDVYYYFIISNISVFLLAVRKDFLKLIY